MRRRAAASQNIPGLRRCSCNTLKVQGEPKTVRKLEALLAKHNAEQADPLWRSFLDSPQLIDKHGGQEYEDGNEYIYWPN